MKLPPALAAAYLQTIDANDLDALARQPRPSEAPVGGPSQEATDEHFVHSFDGSVARTQLAYLDLDADLPTTSNVLRRFLSGGELCVADVPCGAGASSLALLCVIAELRKHERLPRIPLNVHLIGGEISQPARSYADQMIDAVMPILNEQAIFLTREIMHWDVLDPLSNTTLIESIIRSDKSRGQLLVVVSNFNGFLTRQRKKEEALPQIEELFRYCSGPTNAAVWIEPDMNKAKIDLFPWLRKLVKSLSKFVQLFDQSSNDEVSSVKFETPYNAPNTAFARIRVVSLDLIRENA